MDNAEFVKKCGELLRIAKPHLVSCEYRLGKDLRLSGADKFSGHQYLAEDEYCVVTCENGYCYNILITGNSFMAHK